MVVVDGMYVNKMTFLVRTSRGIRFIMAEYVNDRYKVTLMALINKIINLYSKHTFKATTILMDS